MAALQRAFALVERDHVAVRIAEHLDLDVARPRDVFLKEQRIVAERSLRLARRACERVLDLACRLDAPHAPPAAAGGRLDQNGIADALRCVPHRRSALIGAVIARHDRHAGGLHARFRLRLRSHQADGLRRRPHEYQPRVGAGLRERGVLGEKPVAGMHRLGARLARGRDDRGDVEIAVLRGRRADAHRLVRERDVHRIAIGLREHRHRAQPHALCRAHDAAGDLAAIGDQELMERSDERHRSDP